MLAIRHISQKGEAEPAQIPHMSDAPFSSPLALPLRRTIAVVDDEEIVRIGLTHVLRTHGDFEFRGSYQFGAEPESTPDILIFGTPRIERGQLAMIADWTSTGSRVVVHTTDERPIPLRSVTAAGARGVALRRDGVRALLDVSARVYARVAYSSRAVRALCTSARAAAPLTQREVDVLRALASGLTHHAAARQLGIEAGTVKTHVKSARAKYAAIGRETANSAGLKREARADGWLES